MLLKNLFVALCFSFFISFLHADPIDYSGKNRLPIRHMGPGYPNCVNIFLATYGKIVDREEVVLKGDVIASEKSHYGVQDSVGIRLTQKIEELESRLDQVIADKGIDYLDKSHLILTGIEMDQRGETIDRVEEILEKKGLKGKVRVRIFTIPVQKVKWLSWQGFKAIQQRFNDFFIDKEKDYEPPLTDEVALGFLTTAALEATTVWYLYKNLPLMDANVVVTIHAATLALYTVYGKTFANWILRAPNGVDQLARQILMSLPFVLNYNIFGNLTPAIDFIQNNSNNDILWKTGEKVWSFLTTQTITLLLQTQFYNTVINRGIRGWQNSQTGTQNANDARATATLIATPLQLADAIFLAAASTSTVPLELNWGHAGIAGLTLAGYSIVYFPKILDPFLPLYQTAKAWAMPYIDVVAMPFKALYNFFSGATKSKNLEKDLKERPNSLQSEET